MVRREWAAMVRCEWRGAMARCEKLGPMFWCEEMGSDGEE